MDAKFKILYSEFSTGGFTTLCSALCPDLLELKEIGVADNLRGRVVRIFFWVMQLWPFK